MTVKSPFSGAAGADSPETPAGMTNAFFAERVVVYEVLYSFKGRTAEDVAPDFAAPDALFLAEDAERSLKFRFFAGRSGFGSVFSYTGTNASPKSGMSARAPPSSSSKVYSLCPTPTFFFKQPAAQNKTTATIKSAAVSDKSIFFLTGIPLLKITASTVGKTAPHTNIVAAQRAQPRFKHIFYQ